MNRENLTIRQSYRAYRSNDLISRMKPRTGLLLTVVCLTSVLAFPAFGRHPVPCQSAITPAANSAWTNTGRLNAARRNHTATLLPNGKVLVAGGEHGSNAPALKSAELYDPATEMWTYTGSLSVSREFHTATLLPNGRVLVAGGQNDVEGPLNSAEIYDPVTGEWTRTADLNLMRYWHTATLLQDRILVVGGADEFQNLTSAELYDPSTGKWSVTGSTITARYGHTATLLENDKVLVVGGAGGNGDLLYTSASAELYDLATGAWSATDNLNENRVFHTATLLEDGRVLIAGGLNALQRSLRSTELYDQATGTWNETSNLREPRNSHTATLLASGEILVVGGHEGEGGFPLKSAEVYHSVVAGSDSTSNLNTPRTGHTATLLAAGKVLVAGGYVSASNSILNSAEIYDPKTPIATPRIVGAQAIGKTLFVFGENFDAGAVILLNDEEQKTKRDDQFPETTLRGKKVGNKVKLGDRLQVLNPNGTLSAEFIFNES